MAHPLNNYLRSYRKRAGLTQKELAFLLGSGDASGRKRVGRYERGTRTPDLKTILAYEAIFGVPASKLFAGGYAKVEGQVKRRAQELSRKLETDDPGPREAYAAGTLRDILGTAKPNHEEQEQQICARAGAGD
jgi:transcriptional regulator with XRE-family HTH domain